MREEGIINTLILPYSYRTCMDIGPWASFISLNECRVELEEDAEAVFVVCNAVGEKGGAKGRHTFSLPTGDHKYII